MTSEEWYKTDITSQLFKIPLIAKFNDHYLFSNKNASIRMIIGANTMLEHNFKPINFSDIHMLRLMDIWNYEINFIKANEEPWENILL